ncbi:MAG: hypothetical protein EPN63_01240 [Nevskiaceae bacterium]|nr:MAG: hypothetical protein EPN63_01240 [Nevskiaceae bacterium]
MPAQIVEDGQGVVRRRVHESIGQRVVVGEGRAGVDDRFKRLVAAVQELEKPQRVVMHGDGDFVDAAAQGLQRGAGIQQLFPTGARRKQEVRELADQRVSEASAVQPHDRDRSQVRFSCAALLAQQRRNAYCVVADDHQRHGEPLGVPKIARLAECGRDRRCFWRPVAELFDFHQFVFEWHGFRPMGHGCRALLHSGLSVQWRDTWHVDQPVVSSQEASGAHSERALGEPGRRICCR